MLSCIVHLVERERNIIFGSRNIIFGWRNLHMLSLNFFYSQDISYSFEPYIYWFSWYSLVQSLNLPRSVLHKVHNQIKSAIKFIQGNWTCSEHPPWPHILCLTRCMESVLQLTVLVYLEILVSFTASFFLRARGYGLNSFHWLRPILVIFLLSSETIFSAL